jgi:hypothetical protein
MSIWLIETANIVLNHFHIQIFNSNWSFLKLNIQFAHVFEKTIITRSIANRHLF